MLYINSNDRDSLDTFRLLVYDYMKENKFRYSDQRERVLKILYSQHYPVSINFLVKKLNEQTLGAGYATVSRHIKIFEKLDMLIVVKKASKGYLLKKNIDISEVEVLNHEFTNDKSKNLP